MDKFGRIGQRRGEKKGGKKPMEIRVNETLIAQRTEDGGFQLIVKKYGGPLRPWPKRSFTPNQG